MTELIFAVAALSIAGFFKGLVGMGLPPIAMGLLVLLLPPVEAAALMVVPALVSNLWQALVGPGLVVLLKRFWLMLGLTGAATLALSGTLSAQAGIATLGLGALLVIYGIHSLSTPALVLSRRKERWVGPLSGIVTGAVTAFTGVFSLPSVPFFQSLELSRDQLIQLMGISFLVSSVALLLSLGVSGDLITLSTSELALPTLATLCFMTLGQRFRKRINDALFRKLILWTLMGLGILLLIK